MGQKVSRGAALGTPYSRRSKLSVVSATSVSVPNKVGREDSNGNGSPGARAQPRPSVGIPMPRVKDSTIAVVMGGGQYDRLKPLTDHRALPATPVGGVYRLIDIPLSNCINSGVNKVFVLTQYRSASLNRHIVRTYKAGGLSMGSDGFIEVVASTQFPGSSSWSRGSADAVRQMTFLLDDTSRHRRVSDVLVLAADQMYRMDFEKLMEQHWQSNSDITVVCKPTQEKEADDMGLVRMDSFNRVKAFSEKPKGRDRALMTIDMADELPPSMADATKGAPYIGSLGIYVFKRKVLLDLLGRHPHMVDFGSHILPQAVKEGLKVSVSLFTGYWEDVGNSLLSFYRANLALALPSSSLDLRGQGARPLPIYTFPHTLPASMIHHSRLVDSFVGPGSSIGSATIIRSIIGPRSLIGEGVTISDSILMGANYYEDEHPLLRDNLTAPPCGLDDADFTGKYDFMIPLRADQSSPPPVGVGHNSVIEKAIIDKNVRIGAHCLLVNKGRVVEGSGSGLPPGVVIKEGLIVVTKDAIIPAGTVV